MDELTIEYIDENGISTIKELDKVFLSKGTWPTVMYRYQEWNPRQESYGPEKYAIRRYQKRYDNYQLKAKFNISSRDQALKMIETLQNWLQEPEL